MNESEYQIKKDKLLNTVPEEFRHTLMYIAWENGHSYGYNEALGIMEDLTTDLQEPIKKYTERIKENEKDDPVNIMEENATLDKQQIDIAEKYLNEKN